GRRQEEPARVDLGEVGEPLGGAAAPLLPDGLVAPEEFSVAEVGEQEGVLHDRVLQPGAGVSGAIDYFISRVTSASVEPRRRRIRLACDNCAGTTPTRRWTGTQRTLARSSRRIREVRAPACGRLSTRFFRRSVNNVFGLHTYASSGG